MSITNPSIQFLRGTSTAKSNNSTKVLAAGQPFYDTTNKKLYIGDGSTTLGNLTAIGGDNAEYTLTKSGSNIYLKKDGTTVSTITDDVGSSTDTNYYHTPSYSSGLQIATGTGVNALYVPTGTSASTVALGNHTHSGYAASSHTHSSLTNGSYTASAPDKTGTIALTSDIPTITYDSSSGTLTITTA